MLELRPPRLVPFVLVLSACPASEDPTGDSTTEGAADTGGGGAVTPERLATHGDCEAPAGAGVEHGGDITADETWTAAAGPHHVTSNLRILANVTIEPCALVQVDAGVLIDVGSSGAPGKLVAHGEVDGDTLRPITFEATDPAAPWGHLWVGPDGELDLSVASLQHGGGAQNNALGALVVAGVAGGTNGGDVTTNTTLDRVLIADAVSHGLNLDAWGGLDDASRDVWIRGCGSDDAPEAVRIEPGVASTLPDGLELADNREDVILMTTSKSFMRDDTLRDHGVPYRQRGLLYVNPGEDGPPVTLTIEPGVTFAFEAGAGSGMSIGTSEARQGVLVAEGEADLPILFTSAQPTPAAGDWMGIVFAYVPISGSHIAHARIEYAGGESGHDSFGCGPKDNDAAIIIEGQGPDDAPPDPVVEQTEFDAIAGETVIVSGWTDDAGPDLSASNTFGSSTPDCKVSRPRRSGAGDVCDGGRTTCWP